MKEIEVDFPVYQTKQVQVGTRKNKMYLADDGSKFYNKKDCENYEKNLELQKKRDEIKTTTWDSFIKDCPSFTALFPINEEQLKTTIQIVNDKHCYVEVNNGTSKITDLKFNEWIFYHIEDGGDSRDTIYIYTFDYLNGMMFKFFEKFAREVK